VCVFNVRLCMRTHLNKYLQKKTKTKTKNKIKAKKKQLFLNTSSLNKCIKISITKYLHVDRSSLFQNKMEIFIQTTYILTYICYYICLLLAG